MTDGRTEVGRRVVRTSLALLRVVVDEFGGVVVDQIGDELMCLFGEPDEALSAAASMQIRVADLRFEADGARGVKLRIGVHCGTVLEADGRVHGDCVHTAKRMVDLAKADQVITTGEAVESLQDAERFEFRLVDIAPIKGKRGVVEIHELLWDPRDLTVAAAERPMAADRQRELVLTYGGVDYVVGNAELPAATIGRALDCDLVIRSTGVSRLHAKVAGRKGSFVFKDLSTNGTLVREDGGREIHVRRDELRLYESGVLDLGATGEGREESKVRYRVTRPTGPGGV